MNKNIQVNIKKAVAQLISLLKKCNSQESNYVPEDKVEKLIMQIAKIASQVTEKELVTESDDVPMILNMIKILELYSKGNFYGTVCIKLVGPKCRNLYLQDRKLKLCEEMRSLLID